MSQSDDVEKLRAAGFSEDEIGSHLAPTTDALRQGGFSEAEIGKHTGIKPIDHASAMHNLAAAVHSEIVTAQDGGMKQKAQKVMGTMADVSTVYAPIEAGLTFASGAVLGFPMYLGAGLGTIIARDMGLTDEDPKEIASKFSEAVTYKPMTAAGERLTDAALLPLKNLFEMSEVAGKKVTDATDIPVAGAITEATIQGLTIPLLHSFGKAVFGKLPDSGTIRGAAKEMAGDRATPADVTELADKTQEVYEKSGIHPEVLKEAAAKDVTVLQDLASDNVAVPRVFRSNREPAPETARQTGVREAATEAEKTVLERVSIGDVHKDLPTWSEFYTAVKDDLYPIAEIEKALADGKTLDVAESPYKLARLVRGAAGKATQFLDYGTFDWESYKNTGPGLKAILEPVKKDLDGFRAYAVAKRAVELEGRGITTGVPLGEAKAVVAAGGKYADTFAKLQDYQTSLVKYLRDSGLVSEDAYAAMLEANKDYVPFHRLVEGAKGGVGAGLRSRNPIKVIKGSERVILDPLESIIKNTYVYTALAERNAVGAALGKLVAASPERAADLGVERVKTSMRPIEVTKAELEAHGADAEAFTIFRPNAMRPSPTQIRYFEDGKPITLEVPEAVADAFNATDRQTAGMLLKILAVPAKTLRAGSVLAPDFMLRNIIRDQSTAFKYSTNGYIPVWDMVKGAMSIAKKDGDFQDWLKSGGANAAMVSIDRQYLQQHLFKLDQDTGLMSRAWNVAKSPLEVLRIASELAENATRVGEFKRAVAGAGVAGEEGKGAIQSAGFESREVTLDFQRIGAQTRSLNMIAAFMNAGMEGVDRMGRAWKDDPMGMTAKTAVATTLPSVLLWYANNRTPERQKRWREVPAWERDLFWIVITDEHTYRIPKDFEAGVLFGSSAERMLDAFAADKPEAMKGFMNSLGQVFTPNVLPSALVPPVEQATNHSFFTGNPLIPSRLESILPEYQYHEYSTELSKAVGSVVGSFPGLHGTSIASPIVIDNYIRGWTGTLGNYVEQALDKGLRAAGVLPDPPQPLSTLADIPVVKAFVVRYPSATAQSVQDFYDTYGERKKVYATFQYLVKAGDPDAAMKEMKLEPGLFDRMEGGHQAIGRLNEVIRSVYRNPEMSPSDKRQLIDSMYGTMIEIARAGNEAMRAVDKVIGSGTAERDRASKLDQLGGQSRDQGVATSATSVR